MVGSSPLSGRAELARRAPTSSVSAEQRTGSLNDGTAVLSDQANRFADQVTVRSRFGL